MALPPSIQLVTVNFGPFLDFTGAPLPGSTTFAPSTPIRHEATGTPILNKPITVQWDPSGMGAIVLPATDSVGLNVTGFTYWVTHQVTDRSAPNPAGGTIALPAAAPVVDLDLLVPTTASNGVVVEQPELLSVAGLTGAPSADNLAAALDAPLKAAFDRRRRPLTVAIGDSLTAQGETLNSGPPVTRGHATNGYLTWVQHYLGHRLDLVNAGVAGDTTQQVVDRLSTDVLARNPDYVLELCGTNNLFAPGLTTSAKTIADRKAIIDACIAAGALVVSLTLPPRSGNSTAEKTHIAAVNQWLLNYAITKPGLRVVNIAALLADPATGEFNASDQADGTHLSPIGAAKVGKAVADVLAAVPAIDRRPFWNAEPTNLLPNGLFVGNAAGLSTPSWERYDIAGAPTYSKVTRTDGTAGQAQQIVTGSADDTLLYCRQAATGALAPGSIVQATLAYDLGGSPAFTTMNLNLTIYDATTQLSFTGDMVNVAATLPADRVTTRGVLRTPPVTVPAQAVNVSLEMRVAGAGTFRANWARVDKLN